MRRVVNRRRILVVGVLGLLFLLPIVWWLCLLGAPGDLHQARANHRAVLLPGGRVLVIGGNYSTTSLIDPMAPLATWIRDKGGQAFWETECQFLWGSDSRDLSSCELFDPKTRRWTMAGSLDQAHAPSSAVLLSDGTVLESDGESGSDDPRTELYQNGHWAKTPAYIVGMDEMISLPNGDVLGLSGPQDLFGSIYHPKSRTWTAIEPDLNGDALVLLGNGLVLTTLGSSESTIYDPGKRTSRPTGAMVLPQVFISLITLSNRTALAIGGAEDGSPNALLEKGCEIFDSKTETWKRTGDLIHARSQAKAVRLHNGQVLVMGGTNSPDVAAPDSPNQASCELFNPATGEWSETGRMAEARWGFTATLLQDGQVLVTGGYAGSFEYARYLASCELYDPKTGTWSRL